MSASNVNVVVITGNLTRDPELRHTGGGTPVCVMRVAVNSRRKDQSGNWVDKVNYFDVTSFGARAENAAKYLAKGRPVGVEGRLDWSEWESQDGGKRQGVKIIANHIQFLGNGGGGESGQESTEAPADPTPSSQGEPAGVGAGSEMEEEIPF